MLKATDSRAHGKIPVRRLAVRRSASLETALGRSAVVLSHAHPRPRYGVLHFKLESAG